MSSSPRPTRKGAGKASSKYQDYEWEEEEEEEEELKAFMTAEDEQSSRSARIPYKKKSKRMVEQDDNDDVYLPRGAGHEEDDDGEDDEGLYESERRRGNKRKVRGDGSAATPVKAGGETTEEPITGEDGASTQYRAVVSLFGGKNDPLVTAFEDALASSASEALADLRAPRSTGQSKATIISSMYLEAYRFLSEQIEAADGWSEAEVALLRQLEPPQCREGVLEALRSIKDCRNVLLLVSKCAAGDHVAMAPDGPHATILAASERGGGEGTVTLDVALRILGCRRASQGGSCKGLGVTNGMCKAADKAELTVGEAFVKTLIVLLGQHVLPQEGRVLIAVNHGEWPAMQSFVDAKRSQDDIMARLLRPMTVKVAHYRYTVGDRQHLEARTHLAIGYIFAGMVAGSLLPRTLMDTLEGKRVDTYKKEWRMQGAGHDETLADPSLLSAARARFNALGGQAFQASLPRASLDLSATYLCDGWDHDSVGMEAFLLGMEKLTGHYHELTPEDRSKGGHKGGEASKNRGNDRGRGGEGGALVWARVMYKTQSDDIYEHVVPAKCNGRGENREGSAVDKANFFSYARVTITGRGQNYITMHMEKGAITKAKILQFPVPEPTEKKNKKELKAWPKQ